MASFRPIVPKTDPFAKFKAIDQKIAKELRDFGAEAQRKLSTYPPSQTDYVRTGDLGRKWTTSGYPKEEAGGLVERIGNNSDHVVYVQGDPDGAAGERQVPLFREYGWTNVKDIIDDVWPKYQKMIKDLLGKGS